MAGDGAEEVLRGHMIMAFGLLGYELCSCTGEQRVGPSQPRKQKPYNPTLPQRNSHTSPWGIHTGIHMAAPSVGEGVGGNSADLAKQWKQ